MTVTVAKPAATYDHAHHAVLFRSGWLPPSDDPELSAARDRHEQLAANLAAAVDRRRALPLEHERHERTRRDAMERQARGEDVTVPKALPGDAAEQELADAQAKVDAARAALAEHATAVFDLIDLRRDDLRAALVAVADEARVEAEQLEQLARQARAEEARRWVLPRWLDRTHAAEPHPPRFADLVARDPAKLDEDSRRMTGRLTERDHLLRAMGTGVYNDEGGVR